MWCIRDRYAHHRLFYNFFRDCLYCSRRLVRRRDRIRNPNWYAFADDNCLRIANNDSDRHGHPLKDAYAIEHAIDDHFGILYRFFVADSLSFQSRECIADAVSFIHKHDDSVFLSDADAHEHKYSIEHRDTVKHAIVDRFVVDDCHDVANCVVIGSCKLVTDAICFVFNDANRLSLSNSDTDWYKNTK